MDDASFKAILDAFHLSWRGYRRVRKGVKKRLARHLAELECRSAEDYLRRLRSLPEEEKRARELLTVSISRFFRDRRLWEVLWAQVVPTFRNRERVKVWSAGCACGEEAYSFKMLWNEAGGLPPLEILGTDINPAVLERARAGVYPAGSLKEVSQLRLQGRYAPENRPLLDKYFVRQREDFALREDLKRSICWHLHDLLSPNPPPDCEDAHEGEVLSGYRSRRFPMAAFDVLFLRNNLLTYVEAPQAAQALRRLLTTLRPGGLLIIGNNERLPPGEFSLDPFLEGRWLYRRGL